GVLPKEVTKYLKANPDKIVSLADHIDSISYIEKLGISILTVSLKDIKLSSEFKKKFMLFTNDAINLAVMKNNNIAYLASNDSDFEKVDFLTLYKP
ncbi:MAG: type II toxin-antitoxin system VapC family toxin, partial [Thermodesulfobacteriota bacterium]